MKKSDLIGSEPYSPSVFRSQGHRLVDALADFLEESVERKRRVVLPSVAPEEMLGRWTGEFQEAGDIEFEALVAQILEQSHNLQHPRYIGHQCGVPVPVAILSEFLAAFINNGSAVYEMGPVNTIMEKRLAEWMCSLVGWGESADGVLTHGGSVGNLTAMLAARQTKCAEDVWKNGVSAAEPLAVLVSGESHYSVNRAVGVMGLGGAAALPVRVDEKHHMDMDDAREKWERAVDEGRRVFMIVGNACSTATGSYDDLEAIADFAESKNLWFHVDGAHGASALLSKMHRHKLKGIHRADSVVWDAHKMLMVPALCTAVLFKRGEDSYRPFSQKASYLFERSAEEEWFNYAHRTMECTKVPMGLKLYVTLRTLGTGHITRFVESTYDLAREFGETIDRRDDFDLACPPEANIVCFRYTPEGTEDLDQLQRRIRAAVLKSERFYIVQTALDKGFFLRITIINPHTTIDDLRELLALIRSF